MPRFIAIAGAISLALISLTPDTGMMSCTQRASFDVCHHALNR